MTTPMDHLTDDQLSARVDEAMAAAERARADAHLAQCDACRQRLADLAALGRDLGAALTHDPGEAYFASFADRVAARIAAGTAAETAAAAPPARGWIGRLFGSPARLAAVGGAMAVVVAAGLTWRMMQRGPSAPALLEAPLVASEPSERGAAEDAAPQAMSESAPAAGADAPGPQALGDALPPEGSSAAPPPGPRGPGAAPGRMQEMRTLESGEQVPVRPETDRFAPPPPPPAAAHTRERITELKRRAVAQPLGSAKESGDTRADAAPPPAEAESRAGTPAPPPPAARPGGTATRAFSAPAAPAPSAARPSGRAEPAFDEDTAGRAGEDGSEWCGRVRDAEGRDVAGATVTVIETGRSVRTDAEGRFCVAAAGRAATLSVLAVGFAPERVRMSGTGGEAPLAISLRAVPVLGEAPAAGRDRAWRSRPLPSPAEAARWDSLAARADEALEKAKGAASRLTALRTVADARLRAWRAAPTPVREQAARSAVARYLEALPEGPRRAEAVRWRDELPR